jgi:integrase
MNDNVFIIHWLSNVNWHLLRHSNATLHDSIATPLGTVQALLGHSSSEITRQVYLHSLTEDRRAAVEKLESLLIGPTSDPSCDFSTTSVSRIC